MPVTSRTVWYASCDECHWAGDYDLHAEFTSGEAATRALDEHTKECH